MHKDIKEIMFTEKQLSDIVDTVAEQINKDYAGQELTAVIVLKGSLIFAADLLRRLELPVRIDIVRASSYGAGTESSGTIRIRQDLESDVTGRNVLLIEDIVDSGRTLALLKRYIAEKGAADVRIASLLSKPSRRVTEVKVEYLGAEIEDEFVVGYGLDLAEKYRTLPYIGVLKPEVYL